MRWTFIIQQKFKVALLLFCVMMLIIVTNIISRKNAGDISRSFHSMYNDRLIPATDIFYLAENLFNKRLLLESYLISENGNDIHEVKSRINHHNQVVDSLVSAFEKTYLVDEEYHFLKDFKEKVEKYSTIENRILDKSEFFSKESGLVIFQEQGKETFHCTIENLEKLTQIQSSVGNELNNASQLDAANITTLSSIQLILVFVIGAVVQALIFASKSLRSQRQQNYHLN